MIGVACGIGDRGRQSHERTGVYVCQTLPKLIMTPWEDEVAMRIMRWCVDGAGGSPLAKRGGLNRQIFQGYGTRWQVSKDRAAAVEGQPPFDFSVSRLIISECVTSLGLTTLPGRLCRARQGRRCCAAA